MSTPTPPDKRNTPLTPSDLPIVLDSTRVTAFRKCPRLFYYAHILNLRNALQGKGLALTFGGAFAAGLEAYRRARQAGHLHTDAFYASAGQIIRHWAGNPAEPREGDPRTLTRAITTVTDYEKRFPFADDHIQPKTEGESFEYSFAIELSPADGFPQHPSGAPFLYAGRFDFFGEVGGKLPVIVDEKTTVRFLPNWAEQWTYRHQFAGYLWSMQTLGHNVQSVVVRGVGIHKHATDFLETPPTRYPKDTLTKFQQDLAQTCHHITQAFETCTFPRAWGDACTSYNQACPFRAICFGPEANEGAWLSTFNVDVWDPLKSTQCCTATKGTQ